MESKEQQMIRHILLLLVLISIISLTGCGSIKRVLVTEEKSVVVKPPEGFGECPEVPETPQLTGAADEQDKVADYVIVLYGGYVTCKNSYEDVIKFLNNAEKIVKETQK